MGQRKPVYYEDMTPVGELEAGSFFWCDGSEGKVIGPCTYYGLDAIRVRVDGRVTEWSPSQRVVPLEPGEEYRRREGRLKLTASQVRAIREKYATGDYSQQEIASEYDISYSYVSKLCRFEYREAV